VLFSITENGHTALLPVWPSFGKISKFKLKQVSICNQVENALFALTGFPISDYKQKYNSKKKECVKTSMMLVTDFK
jgi:hypothetical protein